MRLIYMALITLLGTSLLTIPTANAHTDQINSGDDDATERGNGAFTFTANTAEIWSIADNTSTNYRASGFRFENIQLHQGEEVENAFIEVYVANQQNMNARIYGNDTDNSVNFNTNSNIIDNTQRPKTTENVLWAENGLGLNDWENSDNIALIIQEIVNRPGWEIGNAITLLFIPEIDQTRQATVRTYDFNMGNAAKLHYFFPAAIENTYSPTRALPGSVFRIEQQLESHGAGITEINATITFSSTDFNFLSDYPENDNTIENCPSNGVVDAEWFVSPPLTPDNYSFFVEWGFTHDNLHTETSDNFIIEVAYPRDPETARGNPGIPTTNPTGDAIGVIALGVALIAFTLVLAKGD